MAATIESSVGRSLRCDVVNPEGLVLASAGQVVTNELIEQVRAAQLQDQLLKAVFEAKEADQLGTLGGRS